jgi:NO-binding membrane sensor protein with MHYT domain/CheY-like chemotaxis protein
VIAHYNYWLVLVSVFVASLAAYATLDLASRIAASRGVVAAAWLIGGGIAMGTGIWSMHFIGMLALILPIRLGYEWLTTFLSLIIAVVVSLFALYIVSRKTLTSGRLAVSGIVMGLGIVSMHYVGMLALRLSPAITYDPLIVAASVVIAVGASTAGLWAAFKLREDSARSAQTRIVGGILLGLAIYGMHYTGMAAAAFAPDSVCLSASLMDTPVLAGTVSAFTILILAATLLLSVIDARMAAKTALISASLDTAREANRAKDEFLAMLAHELRNPLGAISNAIHVMDSTETNSAQWRTARQVVARQTGHLTRMIGDLLDVSRVVSGKITLEKAPVDLHECTQSALTSLETAGRTGQHRIAYDGHPVYIDADRTRVEQIVTNLVGNALTYTPAGGRIAISVRLEGADALLQVRDTGVGISPEALPRVFDLFFQATQGVYRSTRGLGIGLTLVQRLAQLHGGKVEVSSAGLGKGACFTVRMPAIATPALGLSCVPGRAAHRQSRSIVVVEDDTDARETLRMALEMQGHSVVLAEDGVSGLEAIRKIGPDVAIVDIGLPGLNGYQIAERLRAQQGNVFLIALTGYGTAIDYNRARSAGFDAHFTKPADLSRLNDLITTLSAQPEVRGWQRA